jgi:hypothetical protein
VIKVYLFSDSRRRTFNQFFNLGDKINSKVNQDTWSKMGKGEKQMLEAIGFPDLCQKIFFKQVNRFKFEVGHKVDKQGK